jgi:hypothetical protein
MKESRGAFVNLWPYQLVLFTFKIALFVNYKFTMLAIILLPDMLLL